MSRILINNKKNNNNTPFCKVCKDSGKPEHIYTNHFVKDSRNGQVTCPTLLGQECRYCRKSGHTIKYCKSLPSNNTSYQSQQEAPKKTYTAPTSKTTTHKPSSVFAFLDMSDDESSEDEPETFPQLCVITTTNNKPTIRSSEKTNKISYSSMAAKTVTEYIIEQIAEKKTTAPVISQKMHIQINGGVVNGVDLKTGSKLNWATAESDSEDEEEDSAW
jgi:hypothetical protein